MVDVDLIYVVTPQQETAISTSKGEQFRYITLFAIYAANHTLRLVESITLVYIATY